MSKHRGSSKPQEEGNQGLKDGFFSKQMLLSMLSLNIPSLPEHYFCMPNHGFRTPTHDFCMPKHGYCMQEHDFCMPEHDLYART